ncbi:hypothetical protein IW01_07695 [Pectobacterium brasiliense]|nr:hypothetical protein IW01_07695 [Pectobacterium brasiliense]
MVSDYEVTALYDGGGTIDSNLLHGDPKLIQTLLARSFQNDPKNVSATAQGYLVNTGSKKGLVRYEVVCRSILFNIIYIIRTNGQGG